MCIQYLQQLHHQFQKLLQPEGLDGIALEDWIIPLSLEGLKEFLPHFTVSPVQTSCFIGKLIKPKERNIISVPFTLISCTLKKYLLTREREREKKKNTVRKFE